MISIIILHHNKADYSRACLDSLLNATARPLEVINVDNGSRDATPTLLDDWERRAGELGIETKRLRYSANIGAIAGRNNAMAVATGDFLVFLDNDTVVVQPRWLEQLRGFLTAHPGAAIVTPKLLFPWEPYSIECCGCGVSARGRIQYIGRGEARDSVTEPFEIQCAISAAWMMPRSVYETLGALDEVYSPVQFEDLDYCYRARAAGFTVHCAPETEIYHFEHTTTAQSDDINFRYVTTKNGMTFKARWESVFREEHGPSDEAAQWKILPKHGIEAVDWETLPK